MCSAFILVSTGFKGEQLKLLVIWMFRQRRNSYAPKKDLVMKYSCEDPDRLIYKFSICIELNKQLLFQLLSFYRHKLGRICRKPALGPPYRHNNLTVVQGVCGHGLQSWSSSPEWTAINAEFSILAFPSEPTMATNQNGLRWAKNLKLK